MTTPTPHGAMPELPPYPSNISHVTRRIRACEGETAAQVVLEYAMREYARAAIQQAAGAVPEGVLAAAKAANKHWNEFGPAFGFDECMDALDRALGREAGSSDHLAACAGGGVTQPLTDEQIDALAQTEGDFHPDHGGTYFLNKDGRFSVQTFARAIEAAHGINPGSATGEDGHE